MSFNWYGHGNLRVWEHEINRWRFRSNIDINVKKPDGTIETVLRKGGDIKLTKAEAKRFLSRGYIDWRIRSYSNSGTWDWMDVQLSDGVVYKLTETRSLDERPIEPEDFKRKKQ